MFRFTLRDMFWATAVVCVAIAGFNIGWQEGDIVGHARGYKEGDATSDRFWSIVMESTRRQFERFAHKMIREHDQELKELREGNPR